MTPANITDRSAFFHAVRATIFDGRLAQSQVDGMTALLDAWQATHAALDRRWLAYPLATTYLETAHTMQPIEEYGKGHGHPYGIVDPVTGHAYYGRGDVQLTWKDNYERAGVLVGVDLVSNPARALEQPIAARIMFEGMIAGLFSGRKLGDYFSDSKNDPVGARRIINAQDKAIVISDYHRAFLAAIDGASTP